MGRNFWDLAGVTGFCMVKRNIETVLLAFLFVGSSIEVEKERCTISSHDDSMIL